MAEQRQFVLIGNFQDNITKPLERVNKSLDKTLSKLERFHTLGTVITGDFKSMAAASRDFRSSLKGQARDINQLNAALKRMSTQMGKVNRAYRAGGNRYVRQAGRGGGGDGPRPPRGGGGGRGSVAGGVISGTLISNAIISGFQTGTRIFQQSFAKAFGAVVERAEDQLADIGSAGGIYSAAKFGGASALVKTFQDAEDLQDKLNKEIAARAAALPGTTHDYVQNARLLTDTAAKVMGKDTEKFVSYFRKMTGNAALTAQEAFVEFTSDISEVTTLVQQLNPTRSYISPTQIAEDLINQEQVSLAGLRRYIGVRRNATLQAALERQLGAINKEAAGSLERSIAVTNLLREAVPQTLINRLNNSVKGVLENFRSFIFDPDIGLLGLSRDLGNEVQKYNRSTGEIIKGATESAQFFRIFADVFGNLGAILGSLLPVVVSLFSPFQKAADALIDLRRYSFEAFEDFQQYTKYFEEIGAKSGLSGKTFQASAKAGFSVVADILHGFNLLSSAEYSNIVKQFEKAGSAEEITNIVNTIGKDLLKKLLESPFFTGIAETVGQVFGYILSSFADIGEGILGIASGKEATGFAKGFQDAGGYDAISRLVLVIAEGIIRGMALLAKLIVNSFFKAILSGNVLGALGVGVLGGGLLAPFAGLLGLGGGGGGRRGGRGGRRGGRGGRGGSLFATLGLGPPALPGKSGFGRIPRGIKGGVGGGLAQGLLSLASGAKIENVIGSTAGGIIGGAIGSAFGPVGTLIGSTAGSAIGEYVVNALDPAVSAMNRLSDSETKAEQKYGVTGLGAAEQLNQSLGGGAGLGQYLTTTLAQNQLGPTGIKAVQDLNIQAQLTKVNQITTELDVLKRRAAEIERGVGTEDRKKVADELKRKQDELNDATKTLKDSWDKLPGTTQRVLTGLDTTSIALGRFGSAVQTAAITLNNLKAPNFIDKGIEYFKCLQGGGGKACNAAQGSIGTAMMRELAMAPSGSKLVIANSSETILPAGYSMGALSGGGGVTITNNIYQQPGQDAESLASLVALKISNAVNDQRSSYFV